MRFVKTKKGDIFLHIDDIERLIQERRPKERPDGPSVYYAEEGKRIMCDELRTEFGKVHRDIEASIAEKRTAERGKEEAKLVRTQ